MASEQWVHGLPKIEQVNQLCDGCLTGKHWRTLFPEKAEYRVKCVLELVHGDLYAPITPTTPGGKKMFLLIVDDFSRFMWVALLPSKGCTPEAIKDVRAQAEVALGQRMSCLRTDRGGEFTSLDFSKHCVETGVRRQLTAPYSAQQNGMVERRNQMIVATTWSMMKAKGLLGYFWGEAISTAVYLLNRSPTRSVEGMMPYEAWTGMKSTVSHLHTLGCVVYVKNIMPHLKKLDDCSTKMVFVSYEDGSKAYRAYDPRTGSVHITHNAEFNELA
jgi:hypothetical protein